MMKHDDIQLLVEAYEQSMKAMIQPETQKPEIQQPVDAYKATVSDQDELDKKFKEGDKIKLADDATVYTIVKIDTDYDKVKEYDAEKLGETYSKKVNRWIAVKFNTADNTEKTMIIPDNNSFLISPVLNEYTDDMLSENQMFSRNVMKAYYETINPQEKVSYINFLETKQEADNEFNELNKFLNKETTLSILDPKKQEFIDTKVKVLNVRILPKSDPSFDKIWFKNYSSPRSVGNQSMPGEFKYCIVAEVERV